MTQAEFVVAVSEMTVILGSIAFILFLNYGKKK